MTSERTSFPWRAARSHGTGVFPNLIGLNNVYAVQLFKTF